MPQDPIIAIVDDDESIRAATESLVKSFGFRISAFASAEGFLRSPQLRDASCLITDVQMPGMTGVELQARLLEQGSTLPIIFMSAFPDERTRQKVHAAGAIGFLAKPFEERMMIECIDRALRRSRD